MIYIILIFAFLYVLSELGSKKTVGKNHEKKYINPNRAFNYDGSYTKNTLLKEMLIERRGATCEKCGRNVELHVHHKLEVSKGGTDDFNNLQLLCYECHMKEHNYQFDKIGSGTQNVSSKYKTFNAAAKNNKSIKITYKKPNGEVSHRTILPIEIYKKSGNYYLRAHCYLRNEERIFRMSRITKFDS